MAYSMGKIALKYYVWFISFIFYSIGTSAQSIEVTAIANTNKILIGEPLEITLKANLPPGPPVQWVVTDTLPHFEIISKAAPVINNSSNLHSYAQKLMITSYDSGKWQIPPFVLEAGNKRYTTAPIQIDVMYTPFDTNKDYNDIKDIMVVKAPSFDYIKWLLLLSGLLAAIAAYWLLTKNKIKKQNFGAQKLMLPPLEEALQQLALLQQNWKSDTTKSNYSQLNAILKNYLSRKTGTDHLQQTNNEWIRLLKSKKLPGEELLNLSALLQQSDAIKFAKWLPEEVEQQKDIQQCKHSLHVLENLLNTPNPTI